jgi:hypothetical protein
MLHMTLTRGRFIGYEHDRVPFWMLDGARAVLCTISTSLKFCFIEV